MGCTISKGGNESNPVGDPPVERNVKVATMLATSNDSQDGELIPRSRSASDAGQSSSARSPSLGGSRNRQGSISESISRKIGIISDNMVHPAVFESASEVIADLYNKGVTLNYERAAEILSKYQKSCSVAETYFPGARDGKVILRQAKHTLLREGFTRENTLFAQSVCADEINHDVNDITNLFSTYLGEVFHLGGLAGIPFTGKTGFGAYAAHIPDDGHLFILFSPHVGISDSLQIGKFTRAGQIYEGHACGAAIGALNYCIEGKPVPDNAKLGSSPFDYQMSYIIAQVAKVVDEIISLDTENERQAELTRQMYKICKTFLDNIVDFGVTDNNGKPVKIAILGGIQINMPRPMADFFQPIYFEVFEKGQPPKDLLEETFFQEPEPSQIRSGVRSSISM